MYSSTPRIIQVQSYSSIINVYGSSSHSHLDRGDKYLGSHPGRRRRAVLQLLAALLKLADRLVAVADGDFAADGAGLDTEFLDQTDDRLVCVRELGKDDRMEGRVGALQVLQIFFQRFQLRRDIGARQLSRGRREERRG